MSNETGSRRLPSSFRDPSGFVFTQDGELYRQVSQSYRDKFDMLINSGLYDELTDSQLLVRHVVVETDTRDADVYLILAPDRVSFISYPYEWCFSQLKDAALATDVPPDYVPTFMLVPLLETGKVER